MLTDSRLGQQHAGKAAIAVPLAENAGWRLSAYSRGIDERAGEVETAQRRGSSSVDAWHAGLVPDMQRGGLVDDLA